jgi:Flp pilus assembly protein TadG
MVNRKVRAGAALLHWSISGMNPLRGFHLRAGGTNRRGASAVEFAIVAPIFFLVVLGIIEFGRMSMVQQIITNAAREGARVGVLDGSTFNSVNTKVQQYLSASAIKGANVTVNPNPPSSAGFDQPVSVSVSISFSDVSWLPSPFFLKKTTLTANAVMRRETVE